MKIFHFAFLIFLPLFTSAQVGINTTTPKGALDITSQNMGMVVPRVSDVDSVTDGSGNPAVDGTIVYDTTRKAMMFRIDGSWVSISLNAPGFASIRVLSDYDGYEYTYVKASNTDISDYFGSSLNISGDGNTLVVGAPAESSNALGIGGNQSDNSALYAGAAYIFIQNGGAWTQQAYIKGSNTDTLDFFGAKTELSEDGNTLAVSALRQEPGNIVGSGGVYMFKRTGGVWSEEAILKASFPDPYDVFGSSLSLSDDGNTLAVGMPGDDSHAIGIGGIQNDNSEENSGAVYVFTRAGSAWAQHSYIKASNAEAGDLFGRNVSLSGDGNTLAVDAQGEDSNATGINGDQNDNSFTSSGAVYIFDMNLGLWEQTTYIKASNTDSLDEFGLVSLNHSGDTLVVSAPKEDSNAIGIDGGQMNNSMSNSGAVYFFTRVGEAWAQKAYIKASNPNAYDQFGAAINLSRDGTSLLVSSPNESSGAIGINGDQSDNSAASAGAVYAFKIESPSWEQLAYIKASNTDAYDQFGGALTQNNNGRILVIGAALESSDATGINGDQSNNAAEWAGAIYIIQ